MYTKRIKFYVFYKDMRLENYSYNLPSHALRIVYLNIGFNQHSSNLG